jgi:carbonic anhydrase
VDLLYRYDPYQPVAPRNVPDAAAAIAQLCEGNDRFVGIVETMHRVTMGEVSPDPIVVPVSPVSLGLPLWRGGTVKQAPFAVVLGCSDARAPVETIFDQGFNDLFVVRIAGNVLGVECLGSIDFAVRNFTASLKLVTVLGHSTCGAVSAAVDTYLNPRDYADIASTHALRSLVDRIMVAVRNSSKGLERLCGRDVVHNPGYRDALLEMAVYLNAAVTAFDVSREISALDNKDLAVVYGVYDFGSMRVHASPHDAGEGPEGVHAGKAQLAVAPSAPREFETLVTHLADGVLARGLLK